MRPRTFTLPFTRLGDFPELDFGPDDSLTVRPLYSQTAIVTTGLLKRVEALSDEAAKPKAKQSPDAEQEAEADQILLDLLSLCIVEWTLKDGDGRSIPVPTTPAALRALPAGLSGAFFAFFTTFRGDGPNPTTGS